MLDSLLLPNQNSLFKTIIRLLQLRKLRTQKFRSKMILLLQKAIRQFLLKKKSNKEIKKEEQEENHKDKKELPEESQSISERRKRELRTQGDSESLIRI